MTRIEQTYRDALGRTYTLGIDVTADSPAAERLNVDAAACAVKEFLGAFDTLLHRREVPAPTTKP